MRDVEAVEHPRALESESVDVCGARHDAKAGSRRRALRWRGSIHDDNTNQNVFCEDMPERTGIT